MHGGGREILRKQCSKDPILEVGCQEGEGVPGLSPPLKPGGGGHQGSNCTQAGMGWERCHLPPPRNHPHFLPLLLSLPFQLGWPLQPGTASEGGGYSREVTALKQVWDGGGSPPPPRNHPHFPPLLLSLSLQLGGRDKIPDTQLDLNCR